METLRTARPVVQAAIVSTLFTIVFLLTSWLAVL